ncbi:MAG: hypothetical protein COA94_08285 [Rickettsiales bacterium]|nr:MAG: hypothetical protein COA94_08285 [Rickettsiales bacterium]
MMEQPQVSTMNHLLKMNLLAVLKKINSAFQLDNKLMQMEILFQEMLSKSTQKIQITLIK